MGLSSGLDLTNLVFVYLDACVYVFIVCMSMCVRLRGLVRTCFCSFMSFGHYFGWVIVRPGYSYFSLKVAVKFCPCASSGSYLLYGRVKAGKQFVLKKMETSVFNHYWVMLVQRWIMFFCHYNFCLCLHIRLLLYIRSWCVRKSSLLILSVALWLFTVWYTASAQTVWINVTSFIHLGGTFGPFHSRLRDLINGCHIIPMYSQIT